MESKESILNNYNKSFLVEEGNNMLGCIWGKTKKIYKLSSGGTA